MAWKCVLCHTILRPTLTYFWSTSPYLIWPTFVIHWPALIYFDLLWPTLFCFELWPILTCFDLLWCTMTYFDLLWFTLTYFDLFLTYFDLLWPILIYFDLVYIHRLTRTRLFSTVSIQSICFPCMARLSVSWRSGCLPSSKTLWSLPSYLMEWRDWDLRLYQTFFNAKFILHFSQLL